MTGRVKTANGLLCPHCKARLLVRSNVKQHMLLRILYLQCTNVQCSWSGTASIEIDTQISPSAVPNPHVNLKLSAVVERVQGELGI